MPAKSLRLGSLRVPDEWFRDFLRGSIDGDGSIVSYVDSYNTFKKAGYVYARVYLSLVSASPPFIEWIRETLQRLVGVTGHVRSEKRSCCCVGCTTARRCLVFGASATSQRRS